MRVDLSGHNDTIWSVCFSPDGKQMASGSSDKTVKIWNASSGELQSTLTGHSDDVTQLEFRDPNTLVSVSSDGTTCLWAWSWVEKGQDPHRTHDKSLAGERFAFSKKVVTLEFSKTHH